MDDFLLSVFQHIVSLGSNYGGLVFVTGLKVVNMAYYFSSIPQSEILLIEPLKWAITTTIWAIPPQTQFLLMINNSLYLIKHGLINY
jgi:hypothetical protein